jgi:hypothetical protein
MRTRDAGAKVDWAEVAELLEGSHRLIAPKRLPRPQEVSR